MAPLHFAVLRQESTSGPIALGKWDSEQGAQRFARGTWDTFLLEIAPELGDIQLVQLGAPHRSWWRCAHLVGSVRSDGYVLVLLCAKSGRWTGHDNSGLNPSWYVADITVEQQGGSAPGKQWHFECNRWLDQVCPSLVCFALATPKAHGHSGGSSRCLHSWRTHAPARRQGAMAH